MRWGKSGVVAAVVALGMSTSGCATTAVAQAGASDPEALALMPVALLVDAIALAIGGGKDRRTGVVYVPPNMTNWEDPDDWIGECYGPLRCPTNKHFECDGIPNDCYCDCVVS